jgi:hypothetical protein
MPIILPIMVLVPTVIGYRNFEIVFNIPGDVPTALAKLVLELMKLHAKFGGRSEIRTAQGPLVFLDVVLRGSFDEPFKLLDKFGVKECALHPGKFDALDVRPLERKPVGRLFFGEKFRPFKFEL